MRIAFLGNFHVDYTSESHYMKTLRKLGHEVYPLQEGTDNIHQIMKRASAMDALFWVHTHGWETEGIAEGLEILKEQGIPTFGYHLDLWKGLGREADVANDPYWGIEYFFTVDPSFIPDLQAMGIKAGFVPAGVFEDECFIGEKKSQFAQDVVFVGSKNYHSEWPYRKELIEFLEKKYGPRFKLYTHDHQPKMRGQNLNDLYASAKIVIGDTLCPKFNYPDYLSDRVFETTGRGGFIIHPYIKGIEKYFELPKKKGKTLDTSKAELVTYPFGDFEYLEYLIDYFLKHEDERKAIQMRGFERTKNTNTYTQRLEHIISVIEKKS